MVRLFGVWIDETKAMVVEFRGNEPVESRLIDAGSHGAGSAEGGAAGRVSAEDPDAEFRRKRDLLRFYRRVVGAVAAADRIVIFGPGEARREFDRELRRVPGFLPKIVGVEPADEMTRARFVERVREFYGLPVPKGGDRHREPTAA